MAKETAIAGIYDKKLARLLKRTEDGELFWWGFEDGSEDPVPLFVSNNCFIFRTVKAHKETRHVAQERGKHRYAGDGGLMASLDVRSKSLYAQPEMMLTPWLIKDFADHVAKLLTDGEHVLVIDEQYLSPLEAVTFRTARGSDR